jgi:hypothetical protein
MKQGEEKLRARISEKLGDRPEARKFFDLLGRSQSVDLENLIDEVDDSDYSLADWVGAFLGFDIWLTNEGISGRDFGNMLGYLHCCQLMIAENVDRPDLQTFVNQMLTEYGFDPGQRSQS